MILCRAYVAPARPQNRPTRSRGQRPLNAAEERGSEQKKHAGVFAVARDLASNLHVTNLDLHARAPERDDFEKLPRRPYLDQAWEKFFF
jgi:hypothetical protein